MPDPNDPNAPVTLPVGQDTATRDDQFHRPEVDPNLAGARGVGGERKTVEEWAKDRGHLPRMLSIPGNVAGQPTTVEQVNPKYYLYAQAKALHSWPEGHETTAADYDKAVKEANDIPLR